jgi:hypothetical protein
MKKGTITKTLAAVMAVIVVLDLVLVSFRMITWQLFWAVIILGAFTAYIGIPLLKEKNW